MYLGVKMLLDDGGWYFVGMEVFEVNCVVYFCDVCVDLWFVVFSRKFYCEFVFEFVDVFNWNLYDDFWMIFDNGFGEGIVVVCLLLVMWK